MAYEIEIKEIESQPTIGIRVTILPSELSEAMGEILPEVWSYLESRGIYPASPPFARYYAYGADAVDMEAGFAVAAPLSGDGRIVAGELPGGQVATTWHVGPYDTLTQAYDALRAWLKEQQWEEAGAPWEVYWTDPGEVPDPAAWRTEVLWPVK
jgi:effector-binding domain-containing protein